MSKTNISWTDETANWIVGCTKISAGCAKKDFTRENNNNWRGGRLVASNGYVLIRVGVGHHLADVRGYAYEHRVIAEQKIGRHLAEGEEVHHINRNRQDNSPENLEICLSSAHHGLLHRKSTSLLRGPEEPNPVVECGCGCGEKFNKFDPDDRPRIFVTGHNILKYQKEVETLFLDALGNNWLSLNELSLISGQPIHSLRRAGNRLRKNGLVILFKRKFFHKDFAPEQYLNPYVQCGCGCKEKLKKFDYSLRVREFVSGHNSRKIANV